jgi:hypothetical protein
MRENLSKEIFEVHMKYLKESVDSLRDSFIKLDHRLDEQDKILLRNTVTVEIHEKRSTSLESIQQEAIQTLQIMSRRISEMEADIIPIKNHVESVKSFMGFISFFSDNKKLLIRLGLYIILIICGLYYGTKPEVVKFLLR